jgi:hypothetical protein
MRAERAMAGMAIPKNPQALVRQANENQARIGTARIGTAKRGAVKKPVIRALAVNPPVKIAAAAKASRAA